MRMISREEATRLCESQNVVVEFNNQGVRSSQPFNPRSQFYHSDGPYDYESARYFLANGSGALSIGRVGCGRLFNSAREESDFTENSGETWVEDSPEENPQSARQPVKKESKKPPSISVKIFAEDGKTTPPKGILPGKALKLKAVPSEGEGAYSWKAKTPALKLEQDSNQIVTVSLLQDMKETTGGEVVELTFTPKGKPALAPQSLTLSVVKVLIMKNDSHSWGYDEYSEVDAKDHNGSRFQFKPNSKLDILSVQKGKTGLVDVHYAGTLGKELHFKVRDDDACKCSPKDMKQNPIVLEIQAKSGKYKESRLEIRYGGQSGPVVAELDIAVITAVQYKAKYFRVEDPDSPGTALQVAATPAKFQEALKRIYKSGVADWKIEGKSTSVKSKYDIIKNGALDIEPGADSEELKTLKADCNYKGTRIIHVHALRWSYFLAADAKATDIKIKLKNYGGYLDFVGTNHYVLEDTSGKKTTVKIKSADRAKAEFELEAPLGVDLKVANKAALLWPLGGLSGDPTLVSDFGGLSTLVGIVAHELGHSNAGLLDIAEIKNIMHGVAEGNEGLRGRELPLFYHPDRKEKQWATMPGRA